MIFLRAIIRFIDTHHKHGGISRGGGDDDLLGPALQVSRGLLCGSEHASGLNDDVSTIFSPGNGGWVTAGGGEGRGREERGGEGRGRKEKGEEGRGGEGRGERGEERRRVRGGEGRRGEGRGRISSTVCLHYVMTCVLTTEDMIVCVHAHAHALVCVCVCVQVCVCVCDK